MKGKKYSTEDKIRILRQADGGRSILEVCREANISEVTFHRWKNQFGQMEVSEAKRFCKASPTEVRRTPSFTIRPVSRKPHRNL